MAIRVGNADNSRYRSPRRMQVYKPFRLRGPLDAVHRMHRPSLSLSLSLSRSLLVSVGFVPSVPTSSSCPLPPDPFARFINLALLSTLSLSLSPSLPSFRNCSPLASRLVAAVLQFQPHFCASLSRRANTIKRATLSGTGAYRRALFFQATLSLRHFRKRNPRALPTRFAKNKISSLSNRLDVATRSPLPSPISLPLSPPPRGVFQTVSF